jgi:hypothetical protein
MEPDNFWDAAFGGKDMLRLCIGAKDFCIRRNQDSVHAKFKYGDGYQVGIWHSSWGYYIRLDRNRVRLDHRWVPEVEMVQLSVQQLTGTMLNCFES